MEKIDKDFLEDVPRSRLYARQTLTALGPLLTVIACGMANGYSAVLLPQLKPIQQPNSMESYANATFWNSNSAERSSNDTFSSPKFDLESSNVVARSSSNVTFSGHSDSRPSNFTFTNPPDDPSSPNPKLQASNAALFGRKAPNSSISNIQASSLDVISLAQNFTSEILVSSIAEESWIASAAVLPMAPGCWLAGIVMERLGRKWSNILALPVFSIAWLLIATAASLQRLLIGRLICGLCIGFLAPVVPIYIGETCHPVVRGVLLGSITLCLSVGILLCHGLGIWLHWRTTAYVSACAPAISLLISLLSRESPVWLLNKGKSKEARESWVHLRGHSSIDEFHALEGATHAQNESSRSELWAEVLTSDRFLKPLGILCLFFLTSQFTGMNVVVFYCVDMLSEVSGEESAYIGTLVVDLVRLISGLVACVLVRRCARRSLTLVSGIGTALTLVALSVCLLYDLGGPWCPAVLLVIYTALLSFGLLPLPWMLCGELFLGKTRGLASGLTTGFNFVCFFFAVKTAPALMAGLEPHGTFALYGLVALLGTGALYFTLPETKDRTLQEIGDALNNKYRKVPFSRAEAKR
ncbi:hypothetical protein KM043_002473 [Ampulex compressa]|nr:hypothetical protein KM043_002473 [Ampulex compressa]